MIISLSTWNHGFRPNEVSLERLRSGGSALDAVEEAAKHCESDLTCMSVGRGGLPDVRGLVTLDAAIMDHRGACGSVAFVQGFEHVISIARRVMEKTHYIMLAGAGAEAFADEEGFVRSELLTDEARRLYEIWSKHPNKYHIRLRRIKEGEHEYVFEETEANGTNASRGRDELLARGEKLVNESHDTIGVLALGTGGDLAGACTTSGLAFKRYGRVGDSPIIGAGLFVDGEVAAAVATGNGELVMRACSTFHIVEQIRQGIEPDRALTNAMDRIRKDPTLDDDMQVGFLVIRRDGLWSALGLRGGFQFAAYNASLGKNTLFDSGYAGHHMTIAADNA